MLFILVKFWIKNDLLATSPVRHDECADLLKDDCAFLRQGFFRATMREWQVPVCLNRESSTGSFDSQNRIPVSVFYFFQFHLTGYRLQGSRFGDLLVKSFRDAITAVELFGQSAVVLKVSPLPVFDSTVF